MRPFQPPATYPLAARAASGNVDLMMNLVFAIMIAVPIAWVVSEAHDVWVSPDFRILKFKEGDQWQHTLTLKNKHEAEYEWFDLRKGTVWETRPMHRLIRASEDQKAMTQQGGATNRSQQIRPETNRPSVKAGSNP
jgi:hypothetical protein